MRGIEKMAVDTGAQEKATWDIRRERKEAIRESRFDVSLDRTSIANLLRNRPDFLPTKAEEQGGQRQAELRRTLDVIASLPEKIHFEPGITLIVGENGIGKSTLGRALQLAAKIREYLDDETSGERDYNSVADKVLDPRHVPDFEPALTGLSPHIARHITVDELASYGSLTYYDASLLIGSHNAFEHKFKDRDAPGVDLGDGKSHRQYIDWSLFEFLQQEKERAEQHEAWSNGPQIYFIDEPEIGMSPRRHKEIVEQLLNSTINGSILIIPTNSIVLYETDIPRIDLEHPERGIFRPSEFPEDTN